MLFDSLNYLLTVSDLHQAFVSAYQALRPGGIYIFDMNTVYGLAVDWMRQQTYIHNETHDFIELHRQYFDYENLIATMSVTVFKKQGETWQRFDEDHQEEAGQHPGAERVQQVDRIEETRQQRQIRGALSEDMIHER